MHGNYISQVFERIELIQKLDELKYVLLSQLNRNDQKYNEIIKFLEINKISRNIDEFDVIIGSLIMFGMDQIGEIYEIDDEGKLIIKEIDQKFNIFSKKKYKTGTIKLNKVDVKNLCVEVVNEKDESCFLELVGFLGDKFI